MSDRDLQAPLIGLSPEDYYGYDDEEYDEEEYDEDEDEQDD